MGGALPVCLREEEGEAVMRWNRDCTLALLMTSYSFLAAIIALPLWR